MRDTGAVVRRHIDVPPFDPDKPGPMSLADQDRTRALLESTGFSDITMTPVPGHQKLGGPGSDGADAASFAVNALQFAELLEPAGPEVKARAQADLAEFFSQYASAAGVFVPCTALFIAGRA